MRVAALYDIHGNLPALEAALADAGAAGVDLILAGGDLVPGPMPVEVLELLAAAPAPVRSIRGNADREVVAAAGGAGSADDLWAQRTAWTAARLSAGQLSYLAGLPERSTLAIDGLGETLFCHGSPRSDEESITPVTPDDRLAGMLAGVEQAVVMCGHTHMQFDRRLGRRRVVNAGSVGMPYEGRSGAFWALLGPGVELRRSAYDPGAAARRITATGFPGAGELAAELFESPPTREQACAAFEPPAII